MYVSSLLLSSEKMCGTRPFKWGTQWDLNSLLFPVYLRGPSYFKYILILSLDLQQPSLNIYIYIYIYIYISCSVFNYRYDAISFVTFNPDYQQFFSWLEYNCYIFNLIQWIIEKNTKNIKWNWYRSFNLNTNRFVYNYVPIVHACHIVSADYLCFN